MKPLSLKTRLTLLTVVIIAAVIVATSAIAYRELHESLTRVTDPQVVRHATHEMGEYFRFEWILGASMLLAAAVLTTISVWWTMRPIRSTAQRLQGVTHRNLGAEHLDSIDPPAELVPFVNAVRAMLGRIHDGVQAQKRFIADASHELRTPLTLAKSTIQATRLKRRSPAEYDAVLAEVLGDVDRLGRLAGQLLDLARLDENSPVDLEDIQIEPFLRDLAQARAAQCEGAARLVLDIQPPLPAFRANPGELESLMGNLIDNAFKHGPAGGRVTVGARRDGASVLLSVKDEGGQIPAQELDRLFDRFYRSDASRSSASGGCGLGLAIGAEIVKRLGGTIAITSSPTEGTVVSARLPAGS
ncbi:MAG: HAMP domain-containing histidine kinase [Planctomycetaceae bacterium]|nr:HAMP domain-containing histidine kinase [Planctomycetaceae bacterium]